MAPDASQGEPHHDLLLVVLWLMLGRRDLRLEQASGVAQHGAQLIDRLVDVGDR